MKVVRLRAGKLYLEQVIQYLYPLKLSCDNTALTQEHMTNAETEEFQPRRNAYEVA